MKELIDRILEGGPLTVGVVGLDVVVLLLVIGSAIWARRRSAQLGGYLVALALVPALLSMALAVLFLQQYPSADEWLAHRPTEGYPEFWDPAPRILAEAELIRLILYAGLIATMLCLFAAYGSRKQRGRFEHGLGTVIGGVLGVITFVIGSFLIPDVIRSFERTDVLHPPPPPVSFGREFFSAAVAVAFVFIASLALLFWSFWKFRQAADRNRE